MHEVQLPFKLTVKAKKFLIYFGIGLLGFLLGNLWYQPYQFVVMKLFETQYAEQVFKCDNAMRDHYISKAKLMLDANETTLIDLQAAELGLIDCHSYDKLRKKLIWLGLTENELAIIGLKSIEINKADLGKVVQIHEITD